MNTNLQALLDRVYAKCIPNGECMDWTGAVQSKCNSPSIRRAEGGHSVSLRRYLLEVAQGKKPYGARVVTYLCGNPKCVRLEHIGEITRNTLQARNYAQFNAVQRLLKATRVSVKARARAKLTAEIVQAIRASDEPQHVIAARYGIVQSTVSQIKRGVTWQDYSNPFLRLAA